MATQLEILKNRFFSEDGLNVRNIKLFPGTRRDVTAEQVATQINRAMAHVEAGDVDLDEVVAKTII